MINGQRKYKITSRKSSGSSKKGYSAIKKTKKLRAQYQNTENIYEKTVIIEREKIHKGTHNR